MGWFKTVGCECSECGPDACTPGECICNLDLNTAGGEAGYDQNFDVTGDFVSARDIYPVFESFTVKDQLIIDADGVNVYDSGCVGTVGTPLTPTITIPGGTTSVRVRVIPHCDPGDSGETAWTLAITCAAL